MLLRLPSTLTKPFATTAPWSGAVTAQAPKPPKKIKMIAHPAMAAERMESLTAGGLRRAAVEVAAGVAARRLC
jgi:hypothetical protein